MKYGIMQFDPKVAQKIFALENRYKWDVGGTSNYPIGLLFLQHVHRTLDPKGPKNSLPKFIKVVEMIALGYTYEDAFALVFNKSVIKVQEEVVKILQNTPKGEKRVKGTWYDDDEFGGDGDFDDSSNLSAAQGGRGEDDIEAEESDDEKDDEEDEEDEEDDEDDEEDEEAPKKSPDFP